MSLINEALKRTRDATVQKNMTGQPDMTQYRLDHHPSLPTRKQTRWLVIAGVGLMLLGIAGFFTWKLLQTQPKPAPVVVQPPAQNISDPVLMEKLAERMKPKPEPVAPAPPVAAPVVVPVAPPKFTLEGITRDGQGFEALVNGESVRQGEEIDGAKVTAIDSRGVRLTWRGQEIVLRMR